MELFTAPHMIFLGILAVLLFGGKKLPELGKGLGEGLRGFKEGMKGLTDEEAADIVYHGIKGYLGQNKLTGSIPGAKAAMKLGKSVMNRATPGLEDAIEGRLKQNAEAS